MGEGEEVSRDILRLGLAEQGITYGVDMRMVEHIPRDESRYFNLFLIAKGKPAFNGQNGNIIDNFPGSSSGCWRWTSTTRWTTPP